MAEQDETRAPGMMSRATGDEDDVEGHGGGKANRAAAGEAAADEADVEGHRKRRIADDGSEDDVEGHYGQLKSPSSRGE
jgi:regulator of protease activity HflC (stomatin/prohibitin superfamily)